MTPVVLCRFGEIFLKGANRGRFESLLRANVRRAVAGVPGATVSTPHGRILVNAGPDALDELCRRLRRVFGLVSVSPAFMTALNIDAIEAATLTVARAAIERDPGRRRGFKIETRRTNKSFPLRSHEINVRLGDAVGTATAIPVDVNHPTLRVGVEIGNEHALVFCDTQPGPGGLPVGCSGRALLLLSGGIDSPVAGWLAAKRGLALDALYFHSPPFVGDKTRDKVIELGRILASWQVLQAMHIANFTEVQQRLRETGAAPLAVVLYRRMMMRVAALIAERDGYDAVVTGENLGQVASQTVQNLRAIESAASCLVLRPLLTYDKVETTALARQIGTFDTSILPYDDCCSLFVPPHPATAARPDDVARAESGLDVLAEARAVADATTCIRF